jgi:hypothetical protein
MRKVVPYVISFTSIFCLKLFEFRKASFGSFQICVSLKNRLTKKPTLFSLGPGPFPFFPHWPTFATRGPRIPPRSRILSRLATTSVAPAQLSAAGPRLPPRHVHRTPPPLSLFSLARAVPDPYFPHSLTQVQAPSSDSPPSLSFVLSARRA